MSEPENEGINIIWKLEKYGDKMYYCRCRFNWREDEGKKLEMTIVFNERNSNFYLRKVSGNNFVRLNGMLFLLAINGSEWNLGSFKDFNFTSPGKTMTTSLKNLNDFPPLSDSFHSFSIRFIRMRVRLWDVIKSSIPEPLRQYNISSSLIEQSCSFNWTVKSEICGREFFRNHLMLAPRCFEDYLIKKYFNLKISFACDDFWQDKAEGRFEISNTLKDSGVWVKCLIRVKDNEGKYMKISELNWTFLTHGSDNCFKTAPGILKLLKAKKDEYYPHGNLQMHCDISTRCHHTVFERIERDVVSFKVKSPLDASVSMVPEIEYSLGKRIRSDCSTNSAKKFKSSNLNTSMFKLFKDQKLCDVVLIVDDKKFHCHKNVLCSRSPVFLAMFEDEKQENHMRIIHIVDTDADTISLFLSVLYKDVLEVEDLVQIKKLYEVANKYLVTELVQMCSRFLKENLSCSSFCEILVLADLHQDKDLIDFTSEYFIQNAKSILETKEWLELMSVNPTLTGKMMYSLSINTLKK